MIGHLGKTALATTLLAYSLAAAAQTTATVEAGTDDIGVDFYEQNDFYTTTLNSPESTASFYERQVNWMLETHQAPGEKAAALARPAAQLRPVSEA